MLLKYKKFGFEITEKWYEQNDIHNRSYLSLFCYRNSPLNLTIKRIIKKKKYTLVNSLECDELAIFNSFKKNTRNEIRKIERLDDYSFKINATSPEEFINFYNIFAKFKKLSLLNRGRIEKYGTHTTIISGYLKEELTNIQVYLHDRASNNVRLLYSASTIHGIDDKTKQNSIASINRSLHWESMKHFKSHGFKIFDWGGYGNDINNTALAGIDKFKSSFGGKLEERFDYFSPLFFLLTILKNVFK